MSLQGNKQTICDFFHALANGDITVLSEMLMDDLKWWVAPTSLFSGTYDKAQMVQLLTRLFTEIASPYDVKVVDLTAEEDRVSATLQAQVQLKNGKIYQNDYHALYWVKGGKISACKEYFDSYRAGLAFGFPD